MAKFNSKLFLQSNATNVFAWFLPDIIDTGPFFTLTLIYAAVGLTDTHCFEWCFLQKFLSRKIVKQFVFLVQSIVFLAVFLNLEKYIAFISF